MPIPEIINKSPKKSAFLAGAIFLLGYWLIGFDGITFSDDVYYLLAGRDFWNGTMEFNSYHFSTRWGAYVPSGLMGILLGSDPHRVSFISLLAYIGTLAMLVKILPKQYSPWVLVIWFSTQVYFLHFLTKVYPDSLLVFWTALVPFSAVFRKKHPLSASLGVIAGLFFGFLTKETIVFLAPFPVLLFLLDWKNKQLNRRFYLSLLGLGLLFGSAYMAYFWVEFGHPLYRFQSIQEGHYISEFTYADKSVWVMVKRLSLFPILTFVERSYWLWIVFAIPALVRLRKNPRSPEVEFGLAFLSLLCCFWFMSTNFQFYNPLYLNPRHLIILIPVLAFLISLGWQEWQSNPRLRWWLIVLIQFGVVISLVQLDWKMAGFQTLVGGVLIWKNLPMNKWILGAVLLVPALASIYYQGQVKAYPEFINSLRKEVKNTGNQPPILTNNFVHFSREVLFPNDPKAQELLLPIEKLDSLAPILPLEFRVYLYDYYRHAYPKEQEDIDRLEIFLQNHCRLIEEERKGKIWNRSFRMK
ncbi:hypothetical protein GCM10009119_31700 [Algoriphagus jejuensis]|uniref:4-amino-4-deoxy-L-arabinose transferase-like glycosyltransferase n=1 Tax=Algoriphagus jejuensis TaxID=419934 RepID=A0ABP3YIH5_9BACT